MQDFMLVFIFQGDGAWSFTDLQRVLWLLKAAHFVEAETEGREGVTSPRMCRSCLAGTSDPRLLASLCKRLLDALAS